MEPTGSIIEMFGGCIVGDIFVFHQDDSFHFVSAFVAICFNQLTPSQMSVHPIRMKYCTYV